MDVTLLKNQKGQVMVITLLVLTIITVIVVSVVLVVSRDVEQQINTQEYEKYLDAAEVKLIDAVDSTGTNSLDTLVAAFPSECSSSGLGIECTFVDSDDASQVILEVSDSADVENYPLGKDEIFHMDLSGYTGEIRVSWTGNYAMAFTLNYQVLPSGEYAAIKDIYDGVGIFQDYPPTDGHFSDINNEHAIAYQPDLADTARSTRFNLASTAGLPASYKILSLDFKAVTNESGRTSLSARATGPIDEQVRIYKATGFAQDVNEFGDSPAPTVIAMIPLFPPLPYQFDYVLLSPGGVNK